VPQTTSIERGDKGESNTKRCNTYQFVTQIMIITYEKVLH